MGETCCECVRASRARLGAVVLKVRSLLVQAMDTCAKEFTSHLLGVVTSLGDAELGKRVLAVEGVDHDEVLLEHDEAVSLLSLRHRRVVAIEVTLQKRGGVA